MLKQIYDLKRLFYVKKITHKMGNIYFGINEISCCVNSKAVRKHKKSDREDYYYEIDLVEEKELDEVKKRYDLDKPVHYVFDNINFAFGIKLNVGPNAMVTFRNCMFNGPIEINGNALEVLFTGNMYRCDSQIYMGKQPFFACRARKLVFDDETFSNCFPHNQRLKKHINFGMDIIVDSLRILDDSSIYIVEPNSKTSINAKEVILSNCSVICPNVIMACANLGMSEAGIVASKKISIYNRNNKPLKKIISPEIIYNGQEVKPNGEQEISLPTNPTVITSKDFKEFREELLGANTPKADTDKIPVLK